MSMQRIAILLVCFSHFIAQGQVRTKIFFDGTFQRHAVFADTLALVNFVHKQKASLIQDGYVFSGLDSVARRIDTTNLFFHKGDKRKMEIEGMRKKNGWSHLRNQIESYANDGYPFASISFDSLLLSEGVLKGKMVVKKGPEIVYDSAYFLREVKTQPRYIFHLLKIVPGTRFDESNYLRVAQSLDRSSYLSIVKPPDISFERNKAKVYLDLSEDTSTSSFQGVLGLQENASGNTSVIGSLDLSSVNLFKSGHEFQFFWESFAQSSQQLKLFYKHAYPLDVQLSPFFHFSILRQDTTFLNRQFSLGLQTHIGSSIDWNLQYEGSAGTLISTGTEVIENNNLADYKRQFYLTSLSQGSPSKLRSYNQGKFWSISVGVGSKEIQKNTGLPVSFYDTLQIKSDYMRLDGQFSYQLQVLKRQSLFHDLQFGWLENASILNNELYRLGGLNSLRGFNEKNIFANRYSYSRFEFRSFFENESFFYVFYDQAIVRMSHKTSHPFGIGLGFAVQTSTGQFSFVLASGKSKNQDLSFSEMRAHFGFITKF